MYSVIVMLSLKKNKNIKKWGLFNKLTAEEEQNVMTISGLKVTHE